MDNTNKLTAQEVITFLYSDSTLEDRRVISRALTDLHKQTREQAKYSFRPGDQVEFTDRYGFPVRGKITKIMRVNVTVVATNGARWRVSPTLLRKADKQ